MRNIKRKSGRMAIELSDTRDMEQDLYRKHSENRRRRRSCHIRVVRLQAKCDTGLGPESGLRIHGLKHRGTSGQYRTVRLLHP